MLAFLGRLIGMIPLSIGSIIGIIQAAIKFVKEVITLIINLFFPFTPDGGKFESFVLKVRGGVDKVDEWFNKIKEWLLKLTGLEVK